MIRTGIGFDAHAFAQHRKLVIGGVTIPHHKGLAGHSDADVLVHAVIDAILGAAAMGDIGTLFPSDDEKYKNINSLKLLKETFDVINNAGFQIVNIDSTVILQSPKIQSYIPDMRLNISRVLNIDISQVSVKATTTDFLGFTGRKEGGAALATALLEYQGVD
jgi:2-C-methyl-D-erythritol 2,4-cyclodiphosphate synthase